MSESGGNPTECLHELLPCSETLTGNFFLVMVYSLCLAYGAKKISHGSETLMEILNPGIIGGFVLPVLGALPDAAIILFSALGGDKTIVQQQLAIGMGTLAGSNVLLLTLPWAGAIWLGKTDINPETGKGKDKTYTKFSLRGTGVTVYRDVMMIARLMIITLLPYVLIQLSYVILRIQGRELASAEKTWALVATIFCIILFVAYSIYQVTDVTMQQRRLDKVKEHRMWKRFVRALSRAVMHEGGSAEGWLLGYQKPILGASASLARKRKFHHDNGRTPVIEKKAVNLESDSELESDDEGGPDDGSVDGMAPKSTTRTAVRAVFYLLFGTAFVLVFADPMVKSISSLAVKISVPAFYISFVVTPIASNSSELFSSYAFAKKKTKKTSSLIYSSLYGAVAMNNTISLGVFLGMIYFRGLQWNYSAETLVVALVTLVVGALASFRETIHSIHLFWVLVLYPLSIGLVVLLESKWIGWN
jgi:Ca2+/Na+ antiporter